MEFERAFGCSTKLICKCSDRRLNSEKLSQFRRWRSIVSLKGNKNAPSARTRQIRTAESSNRTRGLSTCTVIDKLASASTIAGFDEDTGLAQPQLVFSHWELYDGKLPHLLLLPLSLSSCARPEARGNSLILAAMHLLNGGTIRQGQSLISRCVVDPFWKATTEEELEEFGAEHVSSARIPVTDVSPQPHRTW